MRCVCVCICLVHQVAHPILGSNVRLLIFQCFHIFPIFPAAIFRASVSSCVKYSSYSSRLIISFVVLHSLNMCLCVSSSSWNKRHILFSYLLLRQYRDVYIIVFYILICILISCNIYMYIYISADRSNFLAYQIDSIGYDLNSIKSAW